MAVVAVEGAEAVHLGRALAHHAVDTALRLGERHVGFEDDPVAHDRPSRAGAVGAVELHDAELSVAACGGDHQRGLRVGLGLAAPASAGSAPDCNARR